MKSNWNKTENSNPVRLCQTGLKNKHKEPTKKKTHKKRKEKIKSNKKNE